MDQKYLVKNLKIGKKLAQLEWTGGHALGCVEENDDVWVFWLNEANEIVLKKDSDKDQVWDATASDLQSLKWVLQIPFDEQHAIELGFKYDEVLDVYKFGRNKFIKIEKYDKYYNVSFTYEGNYVWNNKVKIKFIHEFISNCNNFDIPLKIDITKDCLGTFERVPETVTA